MQSWFSRTRRALGAAGLALAISVPLLAASAPSAGAALPPVVGCGFNLGPINEQGAAGTLFYFMDLQPLSPLENCTVAVPFTASITPAAAFHVTGGRYTDIDNNPLTATETVSFVPGRLPPSLGLRWSGLHCADPPVPGSLDFVVGGQQAAVGVQPSTCGPPGSPHSSLAPFPVQSISEVGIAPTTDNHGYRTVDQIGNITDEGDATSLGAEAQSNAPVVGIQTDPTGNGVWVVASDGGVFAYGSAAFHGSLGAVHLNAPIVGMAATPDGGGYWLVAADGGVFTFGTATFHGSLGSELLNAPVVGMAAGPHGGYWLVASDGGIFTFGGVPYKGSTGGERLNAPISGMAATSSGAGYWLVGADNGIFTFGDAGFFGSSPITQ